MLVVTPQFAAGAGIVIAAILAVDLPHAAFSYGPNPQVSTCSAGDCVTSGPDPGGLATTDPGIELKQPRRANAPRGAQAESEAAASRSTGRAAHITLKYQTIRQVKAGFIGMISIRIAPKLGAWKLRFTFPAASVHHVWGAQWHPAPDPAASGGVVVTGQPWPWPGQKPVTSRIVVFATGRASAPDSCMFNGLTCAFG